MVVERQTVRGGDTDPLRTALQIALVVASIYTGQVWLADSATWIQGVGRRRR